MSSKKRSKSKPPSKTEATYKIVQASAGHPPKPAKKKTTPAPDKKEKSKKSGDGKSEN